MAYLAPVVLEKLLLERAASEVSVKDLAIAANFPWTEQSAVVFGR